MLLLTALIINPEDCIYSMIVLLNIATFSYWECFIDYYVL